MYRHFKVNTHMHIALRIVLGEFTTQKSNPFTLLPFLCTKIKISVYFISFLYASFETPIINSKIINEFLFWSVFL